MRDVLLVRCHGPTRQLGHALEEAVEPDRPRVWDQVQQVADEKLGQAKRYLRVAHAGFDREVGDVLRRRAEDCRHLRLVEVAAVAKQVGGRLDRQVAPPLERTDGVSPVLVHDPRRECGRGPVDRGSQVGVEEAYAELGDLRVADIDRGQADVARRNRDRVDSLLAVDGGQPDHVDKAGQHHVLEPSPPAIDLGDDLV